MTLDLMFKPSGSSSGGGGGSSIRWLEAAIAPVYSNTNNVNNYVFSAGFNQSLYASIRVPQSYSGSQINLRSFFYSDGTSGTILMQTVATLIRPATDAITSTTNQRTSTNSAVSLGAGTVNEPQAVTFDLTDTSGQINGVSVSAGDIILIQLTRGTDSSSSDSNMIADTSEVTFT